MRRCVSRELALVVLLVAGCGDNASEPGEPCNGIDDDGDGMVDEGCPCRAYSNELATVLDPMLVSLGTGWATIARSGLSASYVRIDDDGNIVGVMPVDDLGLTGQLRALAWDGNRLSYLGGGVDDTYLAHLTVDGLPDGRGPSLGLPPNSERVIAVTANGYHAAITRPPNPQPTFVALARTGELETAINDTGPPADAVDIVERTDGPVVAWAGVHVLISDWSLGPPWQGVRVTASNSGWAGLASDGTIVLAPVAGHLFAWDGSTVTQVSGVTGVLAVTWTGRAWQVVTSDEAKRVIRLLSLDASLSITDTEQIFTIPPSSGMPAYAVSGAVAGDARRIAVSLQFFAPGTGRQQLIQLCR